MEQFGIPRPAPRYVLEVAVWCNLLSNIQLAQVSELCWEAMLFIEDATLDVVRGAVRRALEECWAARSRRPLPDALAMLRAEIRARQPEGSAP